MSRTGRPLALLGALALLVSAFLPWTDGGRTAIDLGLLGFGDRLAQPTVGLVLIGLAAAPAVAALLGDDGWPRGVTALLAGALIVVWLARGPDGAMTSGIAWAMAAVAVLLVASAVAEPISGVGARYPDPSQDRDGDTPRPPSDAWADATRDAAHPRRAGTPAGDARDPARDPGRERWWHGATGYEIYIRSFADGDGDGVGDLAGIRSRLGHLADLGVDFVWITPFFPSPGHDHGYDVADYRDVDPLFGTLGEFDALLEETHGLGMRLLVDLVPNHTSHEHRWFRRSRSSRDDPYRDHYVWRDPAPDGGPPNNWVSRFGGPAWSFDEATGQYYMHLFLPEQPDLNWANPAVRDEFDDILRFWLDRGVDGFRVDVAHGLVEDPEYRDNPLVGGAPPAGADPRTTFRAYDHVHDLDQPGVLEIYRRWHALVERYGALLLGEVYLLEPERVQRYVADRDGLHLALYVPLTHASWDAAQVHELLRKGVEIGGEGFAYPVGSHDDSRAPTRMGGGDAGRRRALAYTTLLAGMPGTLLLYQGDELGLTDVRLTPDRYTDPSAARNRDTATFTRDAVRTPMPWSTEEPSLGFSSAERTWLPLGDRTPRDTARAQRDDAASPLGRHRALLATRSALADLHGHRVPVDWLTGGDEPLVAYRRGDTVVVANVGPTARHLALPHGGWQVRFATRVELESRRVASTLQLPGEHAAILTRT